MYAFLSASREYTTRMEESGGYKGSGGHQLDRRREDCKGMEEFYCCWRGGLCEGAEVAGWRWERERRRLMLWGVNNDLIMSKCLDCKYCTLAACRVKIEAFSTVTSMAISGWSRL
jgi:hypothetical protein